MRVALVYNAKAGERLYEAADLTHLFREAGHEIAAFGKRFTEIKRALATGADVLAVAGGDGTVAKAAVGLHEHSSKMPLVILPVGTSNNIARSLGITATVPVIIKSLPSAHCVKLDIGHATAPWGDAAFVEAAGTGFIGKMLHEENSVRTRLERFVRNLPPGRSSHFVMAAQGVARLVRRQHARYQDVRADGEDLSGEYIAVEVMNIVAIGPRIVLTPHAEPGDGMLDLLLIRPEHRDALAAYVASPQQRRNLPAAMFRRVRKVEMSWPSKVGHVDDEPWPRQTAKGGRKSDADGGANGGGDGVSNGEARVAIGLRGCIDVLVP